MQIETRLSDEIARYLDLASDAAKLTAQNMANVDTPGYHAVNLDFEREMRTALSADDSPGELSSLQILPEGGLVARPDGNNVSIDRESLNMAEAQLRFRTGVSLLHQQYQLVMDSIHADK